MSYEFSASMMCANYANLGNEVKLLEQGGIDSYHIDIMDGQFVDNFGMGYQDIEFIRSATKKPLEAHLMINNPERYFDILTKIGLDVAYIHPESTHEPEIAIEELKKRGVIPGIAVNPGTSIAYIEELLNIVDRVLVMCVVPGHAGRDFAPYVADKIRRLLKIKDKYNFDIYWDGACTRERIKEWAPRGVKGFVLGTSSLFHHDESYPEIIAQMRRETDIVINEGIK